MTRAARIASRGSGVQDAGVNLTVTAAGIIAAVRTIAPDMPAACYMTGGGCATIYLGDATGPEDDARYAAALGPGSFDYRDPELSTFTLDPTADDGAVIGPDDDGESPVTFLHTMGDVRAYVASMPDVFACECCARAGFRSGSYSHGLCPWCIEACTYGAHTLEDSQR